MGELEDQNLELSQFVQQLKDELKRVQISGENEELSKVGVTEQISILDETNELHVPENIQLKNDNQRLRTLNAALQDWIKFMVSFENLFCIMQSNLDRSRDNLSFLKFRRKIVQISNLAQKNKNRFLKIKTLSSDSELLE